MVSRNNTADIANWPQTGWHGHYHWPSTARGANSLAIRAGDTLDVTIWDSQENSLLTNPGERFTKLENITVDGSGAIFLPYVDKVHIRGLTTASARARIQSQLEQIVPSAQVQLSHQQGRNQSVDVVGGVAKPGAYPMPDRNYHVLSAIADAGGIPPALRNPTVRLLRGSKTYEISADTLFESGSKNALLYAKDTLIVEEDNRSFVAFGASGKEDLIYFPKDELSALEALSLMGGLSDTRADPKGVLVLREYKSNQLGIGKPGPRQNQVVFNFDLTSADGLFAARQFAIFPQDTVLATESPVTSARTILGLFGAVLGLGTQAGNLGN